LLIYKFTFNIAKQSIFFKQQEKKIQKKIEFFSQEARIFKKNGCFRKKTTDQPDRADRSDNDPLR